MRRFFYRLEFEKNDKAGFLSHRDTRVLLARILRRAGLPIHTSQAHRWPSPKISVVHPLPVGIESLREMAVFGLKTFLYPSDLLDRVETEPCSGIRLNRVLPLSSSQKPEVLSLSFRMVFSGPLADAGHVKNLLDRKRTGDGEEGMEGDGQDWNLSALDDVDVSNRELSYTTRTESSPVHPDQLLDALTSCDDVTLPAVDRIVKTNMILQEEKT